MEQKDIKDQPIKHRFEIRGGVILNPQKEHEVLKKIFVLDKATGKRLVFFNTACMGDL